MTTKSVCKRCEFSFLDERGSCEFCVWWAGNMAEISMEDDEPVAIVAPARDLTKAVEESVVSNTALFWFGVLVTVGICIAEAIKAAHS